jgi:ABC-type maltose transport system permease subunit
MSIRKLLVFIFVIISILSFSKVTIEFWHAMSGWRIEFLENTAKEFMENHPDIQVNVQYTGSYLDTFNKTIAGVKAGTAPHVVQIYDIGTKAMIGGAALINFVFAWNMYLWPLVVTMEDKMKTVQIGVKMLIDAEAANNWGTIMAGTIIALVPTLLVFFLIQNLFVKSLVSSGLKG